MDEGDEHAGFRALARLAVDEPDAVLMEGVQARREVVDPVGDVVETFAAPVEEACDGRLGPERAEVLDEALARRQHGLLDTLRRDEVTGHGSESEVTRCGRDGRVEVAHGDTDVVNRDDEAGVDFHIVYSSAFSLSLLGDERDDRLPYLLEPPAMRATCRTLTLSDAVAEHVHDGDTVFLGGFGHAVPTAAVHEIIRQGRRELTIVRSGCDIAVDQLIAGGCVARLVFGWVGNPGVGLAHSFRRAYADGSLSVEEWTNFSLVLRLEATRLGVPFLPARILRAGDARSVLPEVQDVHCPYTGEVLTAIPAIPVDVAIVHAQRADARGNVQLWGIKGDTVTGALAADRVVATVEQIVSSDVILGSPDLSVIPGHRVAAISEVPWGAHPSYVDGYYGRDDQHYLDYDKLSRSAEGATAYLDEWVHGFGSRADYLARVAVIDLAAAPGGAGRTSGAGHA